MLQCDIDYLASTYRVIEKPDLLGMWASDYIFFFFFLIVQDWYLFIYISLDLVQ